PAACRPVEQNAVTTKTAHRAGTANPHVALTVRVDAGVGAGVGSTAARGGVVRPDNRESVETQGNVRSTECDARPARDLTGDIADESRVLRQHHRSHDGAADILGARPTR